MKRLVFVMLVITVFVSCKQNGSTEVKHSKTDQIDQYVKNVVDSAAFYRYINSNADTLKQISVVYRRGNPVMVTSSSAISMHDELYILSEKDMEVVYMHEVETDPYSYKRIENQFYYDGENVLRAQTKEDNEWKSYYTEDSLSDIRLSNALLSAQVLSLIVETEKDRPHLSAGGNAARRQGALYWVEGNKPYWTVMVTPNEKIVAVLNDGAEHYEYPVFSYDKQDEYVSRYYGVGDDGHNFELVLRDMPKESEDTAHPGIVNATLAHRGNVYEGVAVNLMDF